MNDVRGRWSDDADGRAVGVESEMRLSVQQFVAEVAAGKASFHMLDPRASAILDPQGVFLIAPSTGELGVMRQLSVAGEMRCVIVRYDRNSDVITSEIGADQCTTLVF